MSLESPPRSCVPRLVSVPLGTSRSSSVNNQCCYFYCVFVWIRPKSKIPNLECLDVSQPASLWVWKQPITEADGPRWRGFRAGPHADNLAWIWIVSQMSSWINMDIHSQLQLESNLSLSCLLFLSSSSSCEADSGVYINCFRLCCCDETTDPHSSKRPRLPRFPLNASLQHLKDGMITARQYKMNPNRMQMLRGND